MKIKDLFPKGYKIEKAPGVEKQLAKLGLDDEYKPTFFEKIWWPVERKIDYIKNIPSEIKYFIQRGKNGYAENDVWSLDSYLSRVISQSIRDLAKISHGYPDNPFSKNQGFKNFGEWKKTLNKIVDGFEAGIRLREEFFELSKRHHLRKKLEHKNKKGWKLFQKYFMNLWD